MRRRISVIGGTPAAFACTVALAQFDSADVVLCNPGDDTVFDVARDTNDAAPLGGFEPTVTGSVSWEDVNGSSIVVVACDADELEFVTQQVSRRCPDAVVLVVTEPVIAMSHLTLGTTGFPRQRVVGVTGTVTQSRVRTALAQELDASVRDVSVLIVGGHPLVNTGSVGGVPIASRLSTERVDALVAEALGAGPAGPRAVATATAAMAAAVMFDLKRVLPCAARLQGEYGMDRVVAEVPVVLGASGIERVIEVELDDAARGALEATIAS